MSPVNDPSAPTLSHAALQNLQRLIAVLVPLVVALLGLNALSAAALVSVGCAVAIAALLAVASARPRDAASPRRAYHAILIGLLVALIAGDRLSLSELALVSAGASLASFGLMHPLSARSCAGLISPEASAVVIATGLATLASPDFAEGLRLAVDTPSEIAASLCLSIVLASAWLCWVGLLRWYSMLGFFAGVCLCAAVMLAASPETAAAAAPASHLLALACAGFLIAPLESTPASRRHGLVVGLVAAACYSALSLEQPALSPLLCLCVSVVCANLLTPSICRPRGGLLGLIVASLVAGGLGLSLMSADATALGGATAVRSLEMWRWATAGLLLALAATWFAAILLAPRLAAKREEERQRSHQMLAAAGQLTLRARVTGALHRGKEKKE